MKNLKFFIFIFLFSFCLSAQGIKVEYRADLKKGNPLTPSKGEEDESEKEKRTRSFENQMYIQTKNTLPTIDFILKADREAYFLTYEKPMEVENGFGNNSVNIAVAYATDGGIYADLNQKVSYYIPENLNYIRKVSLEEVEWEIKKKSKTIHGMQCLKAVATIKDKEAEYERGIPVEAWFSPELNYMGGPTTYASLPGIILELEMPNITFTATDFEIGDFEVGPMDTKGLEIKPHKDFVKYYREWNKKNMPRNQ